MNGEVFTFTFRQGHVAYNDFVIKASDRLMSLAFRLVSGATKRSHLESMMHVVHGVPLGSPFEGVASDIIVSKSFNVDSGVYIFQIESENSYLNTDGQEIELNNFYFTGFMTITPSQEVVKIEIIVDDESLQCYRQSVNNTQPSSMANA